MIKTTVKTVIVTPVDAERTPVGPATEAVQHILYHVQESPGKATHSMAMIDSGLALEVYGDRTVAALHVVNEETKLSTYGDLARPGIFGPGGGVYTTMTPVVLIEGDEK